MKKKVPPQKRRAARGSRQEEAGECRFWHTSQSLKDYKALRRKARLSKAATMRRALHIANTCTCPASTEHEGQ